MSQTDGPVGGLHEQPCETSSMSKEDELLYDAVMYAFTGIEDNTKDSYGLTAWKKESTENGFRFTKISENGIGTSDEELNKKIRQSKYVQYVYRTRVAGYGCHIYGPTHL
jgi:hypothetical protein